MLMVDQLLSNRASKTSLSLDVDGSDGENNAGSWWHQFVRIDDQFDGTTLPGLSMDLKNAATSGEMYALAIKSEPLFFFIVDAFSAGLSLDATLAIVHSAQRFLVDPLHFGTVVLTDIVESVRNLVSLNLSGIALLTSFTWGYSVLLRFVTIHSTGYLDIRLQLAVNDEIHDLHVLAVPVDAQKHSAEAVNTLVMKVLTALDARAIEKIIGVTVDGDPFHMEKYKHVGVLLRKEVAAATNNAAFYVIHSGTYHVNMVIEELLEICQAEFGILMTLTDIESLCKLNSSLFAAMGPEPTRAASAHWIEVYNLCEWLAMH
uniref:DUF4371 domain-containing protein n=1 Tax=Globisporangium ultimum (strain ATCC 200006 / CBS 805.95 / DAOM BR144) TaxID=431595 RepID=K3WEU2_GLOUD